MGCDGGTIPRRDELVKTKKKPEKKDKDSERQYRWQHCAVSQTKLQPPIVACEMGRLYNKEEVITRLLAKSDEPIMHHIRGLKDIKEVNLTPNPSFQGLNPNKGDTYIDSQVAEFICPITSQEMNGNYRFCLNWNCGCVLSEKALKEVKLNACHKCGQPYSADSIIFLNPSEEEQQSQKDAMMARRAAAKNSKTKKSAKRGTDGSSMEKMSKRQKAECSNGGPSTSASSITVSLLKDKLTMELGDGKIADKSNVSEVYKSIFNTHKSAQNKVQSHWVTCNPQYF